MVYYCGEELPDLRNCATGAFLNYQKNSSVPDYIIDYFEKVVYPLIEESVVRILPPKLFCRTEEVIVKEAFNRFVTDNVLTKSKSIKDICLANLATFEGNTVWTLWYAFFKRDIHSNQDNKYEKEYLEHISKNVFVRYSENDEKQRDKQPKSFCTKYSSQFQKHKTL